MAALPQEALLGDARTEGRVKGLDYSWARPGGATIKAAGFDFVLRYVPYRGDGGKGLTQDELDDLRANGLAVGLVFESTAERHLAGYGAGTVDAGVAKFAAEKLGFPPETAIYFAVDFDASMSQQAAIDDYQRGAASVLGASRVGVYGSFHVVWRCLQNGTAAWFWQTYAWSGGYIYSGNHVYQYLNGQDLNGAVDFNEAATLDGLWKVEDDMGMTDNDILAVFGSTEPDPAERLTAAKFRYQQAIDTGHSPFDVAAQAIANNPGSPDGSIPEHEHEASAFATVDIGKVIR